MVSPACESKPCREFGNQKMPEEVTLGSSIVCTNVRRSLVPSGSGNHFIVFQSTTDPDAVMMIGTGGSRATGAVNSVTQPHNNRTLQECSAVRAQASQQGTWNKLHPRFLLLTILYILGGCGTAWDTFVNPLL